MKNIDFKGSGAYWSERYSRGGNSGAGSYGKFARFKAQTINDWVCRKNINSLVELGCGDGHQASLFDVPRYIGLDVVPEAVTLSAERLGAKQGFECHLYDPRSFDPESSGYSSDAALSLDVIYHLVEDEVYRRYLAHLFALADRYVIIYSSNRLSSPLLWSRHVRHRRFTDEVAELAPEWQLVQHIPNPYPPGFLGFGGAFADFFIFSRNVND